MTRDGLISRLSHLARKQWYEGPLLPELDEQARRLYYRAGDLAARLCLNGEAEDLILQGQNRAACMLVHAERYLADRLAYELAPWPKNMLRLEPNDAYSTAPTQRTP